MQLDACGHVRGEAVCLVCPVSFIVGGGEGTENAMPAALRRDLEDGGAGALQLLQGVLLPGVPSLCEPLLHRPPCCCLCSRRARRRACTYSEGGGWVGGCYECGWCGW